MSERRKYFFVGEYMVKIEIRPQHPQRKRTRRESIVPVHVRVKMDDR